MIDDISLWELFQVYISCVQELVPPQYESSDGETTEDDSSKIGLEIGEWAFDLPPPMSDDSDPDMSDLWVVEDSSLSEKRGRKISFLRYIPETLV